jgi:hypothetical protein
MAQVKPLVLNATTGRIEQLQNGDFLKEVDHPKVTNANAGAVAFGRVMYLASGGMDLARANAGGTTPSRGLVADNSVASSSVGTLQSNGVLVGTTTQWDAVTGQTGGLTAGAIYYLSEAVAGGMTTTPPTTGYVQEIGEAISDTEFLIDVKQEIKL